MYLLWTLLCCWLCTVGNTAARTPQQFSFIIYDTFYLQQFSYIRLHLFSLVCSNFSLLLSILSRADLSQVVECSTICFLHFYLTPDWIANVTTATTHKSTSTSFAIATCSLSILFLFSFCPSRLTVIVFVIVFALLPFLMLFFWLKERPLFFSYIILRASRLKKKHCAAAHKHTYE